MGNTKSTSNIVEIAVSSKRRRSQQSVSEPIKLPAVIEQPKRLELSERDIAFLCSQTGK
jgi:hypothetical protein